MNEWSRRPALPQESRASDPGAPAPSRAAGPPGRTLRGTGRTRPAPPPGRASGPDAPGASPERERPHSLPGPAVPPHSPWWLDGRRRRLASKERWSSEGERRAQEPVRLTGEAPGLDHGCFPQCPRAESFQTPPSAAASSPRAPPRCLLPAHSSRLPPTSHLVSSLLLPPPFSSSSSLLSASPLYPLPAPASAAVAPAQRGRTWGECTCARAPLPRQPAARSRWAGESSWPARNSLRGELWGTFRDSAARLCPVFLPQTFIRPDKDTSDILAEKCRRLSYPEPPREGAVGREGTRSDFLSPSAPISLFKK